MKPDEMITILEEIARDEDKTRAHVVPRSGRSADHAGPCGRPIGRGSMTNSSASSTTTTRAKPRADDGSAPSGSSGVTPRAISEILRRTAVCR